MSDTGVTGQVTVKKYEVRTFLHIRQKKKLKTDERPKLKTGNHKTPGRKHRQNTL